jgi:hypothetical protein
MRRRDGLHLPCASARLAKVRRRSFALRHFASGAQFPFRARRHEAALACCLWTPGARCCSQQGRSRRARSMLAELMAQIVVEVRHAMVELHPGAVSAARIGNGEFPPRYDQAHRRKARDRPSAYRRRYSRQSSPACRLRSFSHRLPRLSARRATPESRSRTSPRAVYQSGAASEMYCRGTTSRRSSAKPEQLFVTLCD